MKPKDVKKFNDILKLEQDNVSTKTSWIMYNSPNELVICKQKTGEPVTEEVHLTRREFQKFVDWWQND